MRIYLDLIQITKSCFNDFKTLQINLRISICIVKENALKKKSLCNISMINLYIIDIENYFF